MKNFHKFKENALGRIDRSKKGSMDKPIKPLIEALNSMSSYFTTSSCSGRIVLWIEPESGKKNKVQFSFISHEEVSAAQVRRALYKAPNKTVWFRFEPMILHVACRTLDDARLLLDKAKPLFKHSGIMTARDKFVVEIRGSEFIETVVAKEGKVIVSDDYLNVLVEEGNKKMRKNLGKIGSLLEGFKESLSDAP